MKKFTYIYLLSSVLLLFVYPIAASANYKITQIDNGHLGYAPQIAYAEGGFIALDISGEIPDPLAKYYQQGQDGATTKMSITISPDGGTIYMGKMNGIDIIDVTNLQNIKLTKTIDTYGMSASDLTIGPYELVLSKDGTKIFEPDGFSAKGRMHVWSTTPPYEFLGVYDSIGHGMDVVLSPDDRIAYLSSDDGHIYILDLSGVMGLSPLQAWYSDSDGDGYGDPNNLFYSDMTKPNLLKSRDGKSRGLKR